MNRRPSDLNAQKGPVVLSPPRKSRRVTLQRVDMEGNLFGADKADDHVREVRHTGESTCPSESMPMSVDLAAAFGSKPIPRPTLNR